MSSDRSTARVVSYRIVLLHLLVHLDMTNAFILRSAAAGLITTIAAVVEHIAVALLASFVLALLPPVGEHLVAFELVHDFIAVAEVCRFLDRRGC